MSVANGVISSSARLTERSESQIFLRRRFAAHLHSMIDLLRALLNRLIDIHTAFDNVTLDMRKAFDNVSCSVLDVIAFNYSRLLVMASVI